LTVTRNGRQSALLVVDTQVGAVQRAWGRPRVTGNVAHAVERSPTSGAPVLRVQHDDSQLVRGSLEWQLVPELSPHDGEPIVHQQFESWFENTTFDAELQRRDALADLPRAHRRHCEDRGSPLRGHARDCVTHRRWPTRRPAAIQTAAPSTS